MAGCLKAVDAGISGRRFLIVLGLWVFVCTGLGFATYGAISRAQGATASPIVIGAIISAEVYATLIASTLGVARGSAARQALGLRVILDWPRALALSLALWVAWLAAGYVIMLVLAPWYGTPLNQGRHLLSLVTDEPHLAHAALPLKMLMLIRAIVLVPIGEELLFRGALYGWMRKHLTVWPSVLLSSTAFALMHIYPAIYPFVWLYGLGAAWIREHTGQISTLIAIHSLNSVVLLALAVWLQA